MCYSISDVFELHALKTVLTKVEIDLMNPDDLKRVRDLFERAIQLPRGARTRYVAEICPADELRDHVLQLLAAHEQTCELHGTGLRVRVMCAPLQRGPASLPQVNRSGFDRRDVRLRGGIAIAVIAGSASGGNRCGRRSLP